MIPNMKKSFKYKYLIATLFVKATSWKQPKWALLTVSLLFKVWARDVLATAGICLNTLLCTEPESEVNQMH